MNKDQVKGRVKEAEGAAKEVAGKVSGKDSLELEGKLLKAAGKAQASFGDTRNATRKDKDST